MNSKFTANFWHTNKDIKKRKRTRATVQGVEEQSAFVIKYANAKFRLTQVVMKAALKV